MRSVWWLVLGGQLVTAVPVGAEDVTLPAVRDTSIFENDARLSDGQGTGLFSGPRAQGAGERRALVAFDVQALVPAGSRITKASLKLQLTRTRNGSARVGAHRVVSTWGEGESVASGEGGGGAMATPSDATWSHALWPDQAWSQEGGDLNAEPSATTDVKGPAVYTWSSPALTEDVQLFLDQPEQNHGWILIAQDVPQAVAKRFASRESPQGAPSLVLSFTPPAQPFGVCCQADGSCGYSLEPGAECSGSYLGAGTHCGPSVCPEPTGACCIPDAHASCEIKRKSACPSEQYQGNATTCEPDMCPVVLTPFVDALPLPAVAVPDRGEAGAAATYRLRMIQTQQQLHRDLPATTVWGYSDGLFGGYPGPTIEARRGARLSVIWMNDLRDERGELLEQHPLAVDACVHGVRDATPHTVVHLHGGHVASRFDGQPEATLQPGERARYEYPNQQRAATLWYHDHAIGITRLNVYMGLAGFYLLRDDEEDALGLPSGPYEIPLAIQDRSFYSDGRLRYPERWQESFFGDNAVVNGKVSPYLHVKRGKYRFRLLNGSTSRAYTLSLSNGRLFQQIGNDGGLFAEPIWLSELSLVPGERADIVIDFKTAGPEVILKNSARSPFPAGGARAAALENILKFVVDQEGGHDPIVPIELAAIEGIDESEASVSRDLQITPQADSHCGGDMWTIDGLGWDDITELPQLGTTEIWRFINQSGVTHPMHMHSLFFQVLDRQSFRFEAGEFVAAADPEPPQPSEQGFKDTVQVGPFEAVRVIARFEDYAGRFPYHCHLIEHEDHGMMRQFEVQSACGDGAIERDLEQCDDGNQDDGDGCDRTCKHEQEGQQRPQSSDSCSLGALAATERPALVGFMLGLVVALGARRSRRVRDA